jgi:hypothetical protein
VDDLVIFEPIDLDGNLVGLEEASGEEVRAQAERDIDELEPVLPQAASPDMAGRQPVGVPDGEENGEGRMRPLESEEQSDYSQEMSNEIEPVS